MNAASARQAGCRSSLSREDAEKAILDLDCIIQLPSPLKLDYTVLNKPISVRARLVGPEGAPVILVLGGISANRHVCDAKTEKTIEGASGEKNIGGKTIGWWRELAGANCILNTQAYRLLSFDFFPDEDFLTPDESAEQAQTNSLAITPSDQAEIARRICDYFGIDQLHAMIGSSYGGMIALSFGALFPKRVKHLIVACAAHRPHPMGTAWRSIQRKIVRFGLDTCQADRALSLARELGMTTYRTPQEFAHRFSATPDETEERRFEVEHYLETRGQAFIGKMSPQRYLTLSKSIDLHAVNPADIQTPVTLIGFRQDQIVPIDEVRFLHQKLPIPLHYFEHDSIYGHDAFLKESAFLADVLKNVLNHVV